MKESDVKLYMKMKQDILFFILMIWGLKPQPVKQEYKARYDLGMLQTEQAWQNFVLTVKADWFEPFVKDEMLTWQQVLILEGVNKANNNKASKKITIVSGRGIGKSCTLSLIVLWFLYIYPNCVIPCTAPTSDQLKTVLWAEIARWLDKMPDDIKALYALSSEHIRMKESPETWFARARTSSKETPEALSGVHADNILAVADEASAIDEKVWEMGQGVLTSPNAILIMISNGTRPTGYFYRSHNESKEQYQRFQFSTIDSPVADPKFVESVKTEYCGTAETDDDLKYITEYRVNVLGLFPMQGVMDDDGYVQLFNEKDLHFISYDPEWKPVGRTIGALDPSGDGQDTSEWAVRNRLRVGIVSSEQTSNPKGMAEKSITICDKYNIDPIDFIIDAFGVGHPIAQEIALMTSMQKRPWRVTPVNVGNKNEDPDDDALYSNLRAMMFFKFRAWCRAGGEIMESPGLRQELLSLRYKVVSNKKYQMMDKVTMRKYGFRSPNKADAIALTFLRPDKGIASILGDSISQIKEEFDPHQTM
jgi:hypothetical protein